MIRLAGKVPDDEIEVRYTGLRPGEKLTEELFHPDERLTPTSNEKILLAEGRSIDSAHFWGLFAELGKAVEVYDHVRAKEIAISLVPEYELRDAGRSDPTAYVA
jgi:FlaA1/EpsC-like NDP-sugar epimerase